MKRVFMLALLSITSLFGFGYDKDVKIDANSITYQSDGSIIMTFKATSPDLMVIKHDIEYNSDEFTIGFINENSYFHIEENYGAKGDKQKVTLLLDSQNSFNSIEYMKIKLIPKNNITKGVITVDNASIANSDHKILKAAGSVLTINIENESATLTKEEIVMQNQLVKYIRSNKKIVLIICGIVLLLIIFKNVTKKTTEIRNKNKNYFTDMKNPNNISEIKNEEGIELIKKVESEEQENPISDDIFKGKYEVFVILLLIGSLFTFTNVKAENNNAQEIRENIVKGQIYKESLDLNKDNKVNLIDLVYAIAPQEVTNKGDINYK